MLNIWLEACHRWTPWDPTCIMEGPDGRGVLCAVSSVLASDADMERFWNAEPEWLVFRLAIVVALVTVAWYVVEKIRPKPVQKEPKASQWLSKFRELHSQGKLSDEEFRTIKTNLATQLQDELNDNGDEG